MRNRGLTPVVGFTLLVGITAIGAMSLFAVGMSLADATQSSAERQQLDQSMAQFADTANEIALDKSASGEFQISGTDGGNGEVLPNAGHIEMWVENDSSKLTILDKNLGAYRYKTEDDYEVVFQGGGVWKASGDGPAQVVQSPPFDYRNEEDPTLTFELVRIMGSNQGTGNIAGGLSRVNKSDAYPEPGQPNPLQDGSVYLQIESNYCGGWEQFFRDRTDSAIQESCSTTGETSTGELRVLFSVPFEFEGLGSDPVSASTYTGNQIDETIREYNRAPGPQNSPSPDSLIESRVAECQNPESECSPLSQNVDDGGKYFIDEMSAGESYTFDTSNGDIEVVVDGTVDPDSIEITGPGNVTMFANGDVFPSPTGNYGSGDADQFRILVHSDYQVGTGGGGGGVGGGGINIWAFVYAPGSDVFIGPGNTNYEGGIVGDKIDAHSGSANFNPQMDVTDIKFNFGKGGEPFYYLHVSETTLKIEI